MPNHKNVGNTDSFNLYTQAISKILIEKLANIKVAAF